MSEKIGHFKMLSLDGKMRDTDSANRENFQEHMDDSELIFTVLEGRSTMEINHNEDARGMKKLGEDSHAGGTIAWDARKAFEKRFPHASGGVSQGMV